jgi:hypothetical protein
MSAEGGTFEKEVESDKTEIKSSSFKKIELQRNVIKLND